MEAEAKHVEHLQGGSEARLAFHTHYPYLVLFSFPYGKTKVPVFLQTVIRHTKARSFFSRSVKA